MPVVNIYLLSTSSFTNFTVPSGATLTLLPGIVESSSSKTVKFLGLLCVSFGGVTVFDGPVTHPFSS